MILGTAVPPLVQKALGREHYVRWRSVYLPAITALDALALLRLQGWELLPNVQSGDWAKLAFKVGTGCNNLVQAEVSAGSRPERRSGGAVAPTSQSLPCFLANRIPLFPRWPWGILQVYLMATSHLFTLCLFRTLVFRHQAVMQTGLAGAGLVCVWHHCLTLGCKYEPDFNAWADLQRWAALPALVTPLPQDLVAAVVGKLPLLGEGAEPGQRAQGCQQACFIVHGTAVVLLGFLLPLTIGASGCWAALGSLLCMRQAASAGLITAAPACSNMLGPQNVVAPPLPPSCARLALAAVYNRERQLRQRFLTEEAVRGWLGRAQQAALQAIDPPGASASGQVLLAVTAVSGLCLAVRVLAFGGMEELPNDDPDRSSP